MVCILSLVAGYTDDSGLGSGRIPFDVNAALMPAALRAIAALAREGVYPECQWGELADEYAKIWEDKTLPFFEVRDCSSSPAMLTAYVGHHSPRRGSQAGEELRRDD